MRLKKTIKMAKFLDEMYKEYRKISGMIGIMEDDKAKRMYEDKLITINYLCKSISNCRIMLMNRISDYWVAYECEHYKTVREWRNKK